MSFYLKQILARSSTCACILLFVSYLATKEVFFSWKANKYLMHSGMSLLEYLVLSYLNFTNLHVNFTWLLPHHFFTCLVVISKAFFFHDKKSSTCICNIHRMTLDCLTFILDIYNLDVLDKETLKENFLSEYS